MPGSSSVPGSVLSAALGSPALKSGEGPPPELQDALNVEALPAQILHHLLDEVVAIDQKHRGAGLGENPHDGPKTPGRVAIFHASLVPCAGTVVSAISLMS
jgi:hypothetical protein